MSDDGAPPAIVRLMVGAVVAVVVSIATGFAEILATIVELFIVLATAAFGEPARVLLVAWETMMAAIAAGVEEVAPIVLLVVGLIAALGVREQVVAATGTGPKRDGLGLVSLLERTLGSSGTGSETERTIEDAVEDVRASYVAGEIDEIELERQLSRALDPEFHELIGRLKDVGGIDDELAEPVAIRFGSVDALRAASDDELRGVNGIGEQRAAAIRDEIGRTTASTTPELSGDARAEIIESEA